MKWNDPRMIYLCALLLFAFLVLGIVARLAYAIALGKVEEVSSYGLHELLIILTVVSTKVVDALFGAVKVVLESLYGKNSEKENGPQV